MDELIEQIAKILKDYRREDIGFLYNTEINKDHVTKWINQFNEDDREFILKEFLHLLPNSYLTKERTLAIISSEFEVLRKDFGYETVQDFLDETIFLDCQQPGKSQKILLGFIEEELKIKFGYSLSDCGKKNIKNWIYFDDVLASGGNFKKDILHEIENFGEEDFNKSGIRIIASFIILHTWGTTNVRFSLDTKLGFKLGNKLKFYRVAEIENNPRINYFNLNPEFNHIFPEHTELGDEMLNYIETLFERKYDMSKQEFAFRNTEYPKEEVFFSSPEIRKRYEKILSEKGYEIMTRIENPSAQSLRPLGMTPPSYKTLGTGTHFFTWRNISNTCPLVFWWGANDWYPLFPAKRGPNWDIWD
ncbi:MAG: hypothetical protein ABI441_02230 [Flavobacterium sp.]